MFPTLQATQEGGAIPRQLDANGLRAAQGRAAQPAHSSFESARQALCVAANGVAGVNRPCSGAARRIDGFEDSVGSATSSGHGIHTVKQLPRPGSLAIATVPPCSSVSRWTITKTRPVPSLPRVVRGRRESALLRSMSHLFGALEAAMPTHRPSPAPRHGRAIFANREGRQGRRARQAQIRTAETA